MNKRHSIRVILPYHLRNLARISDEAMLDVGEPVTLGAVLQALELRYPALQGTIRDHDAGPRRPLVRFFACKEDLSGEPLDSLLPGPVIEGAEPFLIVGAMAGG